MTFTACSLFALQIREAFQHAFHVLTSVTHEKRPRRFSKPASILGQIVQVDTDTTAYRQWAKQFIGTDSSDDASAPSEQTTHIDLTTED